MIYIIVFVSINALLLTAVIKNDEKFIKGCLIPFVICACISPMRVDSKFDLSLGSIVACVFMVIIIKLIMKLSLFINEDSAFQVLAITTILTSGFLYILSRRFFDSMAYGYSVSILVCPLLLLVGNAVHAICVRITEHHRHTLLKRKLRAIITFVNSYPEAARVRDLLKKYKVKSSIQNEIVDRLETQLIVLEVDGISYIVGKPCFNKLLYDIEKLLLQYKRLEMDAIQKHVTGSSFTGFFIPRALNVLINNGKVIKGDPGVDANGNNNEIYFFSHVDNNESSDIQDLDDDDDENYL